MNSSVWDFFLKKVGKVGETAAILGSLSGGAAVAAAFCGMNTVSVTSDQKWADVTRARLEALAKEATSIADSKSSDSVGQLNEAQYFERYPEDTPGKPNVLMAPTLSSASSGKGIHRNIVCIVYCLLSTQVIIWDVDESTSETPKFGGLRCRFVHIPQR